MKAFLFVVFFLPLLVFGQQQVTLELSTGDCRKNQAVRIGSRDTIRFYKNGQLYKQIIPMNYSRWPIEIEDFTSGTYKVTYKNLYGQTTKKTVIIPDTTEYELSLCPDELEEYPLNSLAGLQSGETIKVNFS